MIVLGRGIGYDVRVGSVGDVFLVVLFVGVLSGELHLRLRRESDGKVLIFVCIRRGWVDGTFFDSE